MGSTKANAAADKPWLDIEEWAKREVISQDGVRGPFVFLMWVILGTPALLVFQHVFGLPPGSEVEWVSVTIASLVFLMLGAFTYSWLRWCRYGNSTCKLITLPGVVGGWLKVDVECGLQPGVKQSITARLTNRVRSVKGSSRVVWRMERKLTVLAPARRPNGHCVLPIRLQIPRHPDQIAIPIDPGWFDLDGFWILEVVGWGYGLGYIASFSVPVYDTKNAPEMEQRPERESMEEIGSV